MLAFWAAWSTLALELAVVSWASRARIASAWEVQHGYLGLSPTWVLLGAAGGALGGSAWILAESPSRRARTALGLLCGVGAGAVGWGVGGGRHLAEWGPRLGFAGLVAVTVGLAAFAIAPGLRRALAWARQGDTQRLVWTSAVLATIALVESVNLWVLVRLYPAFHAGLTAIALGLAVFAWAPWSVLLGRPGRAWLAATVGVVLLAAAGLVPGSRAVRGFDNLRILLLDQGPSLRWGVQLAAALAPPPPLPCADTPCDEPASEPEPTSSSGLDWTGRDIVLITIDALRADRLGASRGERPLTPELDALGREGAVFEAAYAPTPHTSYSITSLMTGKYMRPLLLQGAGEDSDTWAKLLRTYEYRTAAFYPPAVFFIDTPRFRRFESSRLDFEYSKVEFAEGQARVEQIRTYLAQQPREKRVFLWLHLFGPHEPYEEHPGFEFGPRDQDRYDSEVAFVDHTVGQVVRLVRERDPGAALLITADHGEEFGEHGGRYHGTTVYEEQVRVPLIVVAPGSVPARRIQEPVQTIDLLPTVLSALAVPRPARIRGRDLGPLLAPRDGGDPASAPKEGEGFAFAETEDFTLLAEGSFRLVCERKIGACRLFDLTSDPQQLRNVASRNVERFEAMRTRSRQLVASHGQYESRGLRAEGKGWPAPILRGIAGDGDAALELSDLLDDADPAIRRKAAELLFELRHPDTSASLRLSLTRDEDPIVRRWAALGLTRLGEGAPLVYELVRGDDVHFRRLAALALAEAGDGRGEGELIAWWNDPKARDFERSRQLLAALARIRSKKAVGPLVRSLDDVRLRPEIAATLATIGDKDARYFLVRALMQERYQTARSALVEAITALGGKSDLVIPLVRFLGVPDPLQGGLEAARRAGILHQVGGPKTDQLGRIRSLANSGVVAHLNVPPGGNGTGVRAVVRATTRGPNPGRLFLQKGTEPPRINSNKSQPRVRYRPTIEREASIEVPLRPSSEPVEVAVTLPASWKAKPGHPFALALFADQNVELHAIALVPLADELPPPEPEPWEPE